MPPDPRSREAASRKNPLPQKREPEAKAQEEEALGAPADAGAQAVSAHCPAGDLGRGCGLVPSQPPHLTPLRGDTTPERRLKQNAKVRGSPVPP